MKTSVVIATYNGEEYIEEQLETIKDQTKIVDEVLIFDDLSQDRTVFLIKNFIEKYGLSKLIKAIVEIFMKEFVRQTETLYFVVIKMTFGTRAKLRIW